ncbi:GNAT family N-acetyltransferase [Gorillibacterium sp. sgz5001074]|uniref:GNAT family N-acetyltransferase n=1 Tax=Gorillibacterium sp. sgz5001074 TaxID=3446695 RepID=UPI003F6772BF
MKWSIRAAEGKDREGLVRLMEAYIVDFYGRPHPGEERLADLLDRLSEGAVGTQFVAEQEGRLVGFATLYFGWSTLRARPVLVLNDLYVEEACRGTGAARALFEVCRGYGAEHGYAAMSWETAEDNERAQAFYAKMGGVRGTWVSYSADMV